MAYFRHKKSAENSITKFVNNLKKKFDLIFLDEFQVTNIVDAMILGKLFERIFKENIKIIKQNSRVCLSVTVMHKDNRQRVGVTCADQSGARSA